jgi:hypothetical protein
MAALDNHPIKFTAMKIISLAALILVGCASNPPPQPKLVDNPASPNDCLRAYNHMIDLVVDTKVDPSHTYTPTERTFAIQQTDQVFIETGVATQFFLACHTKLTKTQAQCIIHSTMLDLSLCVKRGK